MTRWTLLAPMSMAATFMESPGLDSTDKSRGEARDWLLRSDKADAKGGLRSTTRQPRERPAPHAHDGFPAAFAGRIGRQAPHGQPRRAAGQMLQKVRPLRNGHHDPHPALHDPHDAREGEEDVGFGDDAGDLLALHHRKARD